MAAIVHLHAILGVRAAAFNLRLCSPTLLVGCRTASSVVRIQSNHKIFTVKGRQLLNSNDKNGEPVLT